MGDGYAWRETYGRELTPTPPPVSTGGDVSINVSINFPSPPGEQPGGGPFLLQMTGKVKT